VKLFNRIINRHLRFDLLQQLPSIDAKLIARNMLAQAYTFTYYNPTGRYRLKLSNKSEREVALTLLMFNRKYKNLVSQGDISDRSRMGNQSCFRNEQLAGVPFTYSEDFVLPVFGLFECDFIYLANPPHEFEKTLRDKVDMSRDLLMHLDKQLDLQIAVFRILSEYLVISSDQL
jgi:hypothetical protein